MPSSSPNSKISPSPTPLNNAQPYSNIALATPFTTNISSMSPRPRKATNARAKKPTLPLPRVSTSHAHDLDPRPTSIPSPILMSEDTWLYDLGSRKLWVRSREPVDWKQMGTLTTNRDLNYDSDETIDDPTHPPTKVEDQRVNQQKGYRSNLATITPIASISQKEAKRDKLPPAPPPTSQDTETAYDTDATISEPIDAEESPDQKEADRKIFQHAMRQRRAWNLENEEEGMSAKVALPVYSTRIV